MLAPEQFVKEQPAVPKRDRDSSAGVDGQAGDRVRHRPAAQDTFELQVEDNQFSSLPGEGEQSPGQRWSWRAGDPSGHFSELLARA